ncbi:uncharacterized protein [Anomalospiza imberbis]|uniref:uncharacterized protein isoform X1 n=1 Tax=Anomalospiza imberbis TaxID=187417 RepID=UPI00358E10E6
MLPSPLLPRLLYDLRFLGQTSVGTHGGKEVLEGAIPAVLERSLAAREVLFDVKEAEVLVQEKASSKVSDIQGLGIWWHGEPSWRGPGDSFKPGTGPTGPDHSPKHQPLPVPCAAPVPPSLPLHLLRGTPHVEPQDLCLLCGVSAACGPWQADRGMWVWENEQARSRAAARALVRWEAGLGLELCWIMDVFPILALPPRALMGARWTAWCLHPVLSKNARKSSGESLQDLSTRSGLSEGEAHHEAALSQQQPRDAGPASQSELRWISCSSSPSWWELMDSQHPFTHVWSELLLLFPQNTSALPLE